MGDDIARTQADDRGRTVLDFLDHHAALDIQALALLGGQVGDGHAQAVAAAFGARSAHRGDFLVVVRKAAYRHAQGLALAVADHVQVDLVARLHVAHQVRQEDHIAHLQATLGRRAVFHQLRHQRAGRLVEAEGLGEILVHFLDHHAQPAATDLAGFLQLVGDVQRDIDRNGEGQAHEAAGTGEDL